jgi:mono/diheme cytochrome c family protein
MAMLTVGMFPVKPVPDPEPPAPVAKGPTVEYGAYIVKYVDCALCHVDTLHGGTSNLAPRGPSLVGLKAWTADQFVTAMRTGATPFGEVLSDEVPWENFGRFDDDSLNAVYEFLRAWSSFGGSGTSLGTPAL